MQAEDFAAKAVGAAAPRGVKGRQRSRTSIQLALKEAAAVSVRPAMERPPRGTAVQVLRCRCYFVLPDEVPDAPEAPELAPLCVPSEPLGPEVLPALGEVLVPAV